MLHEYINKYIGTNNRWIINRLSMWVVVSNHNPGRQLLQRQGKSNNWNSCRVITTPTKRWRSSYNLLVILERRILRRLCTHLNRNLSIKISRTNRCCRVVCFIRDLLCFSRWDRLVRSRYRVPIRIRIHRFWWSNWIVRRRSLGCCRTN